MVDLIAQLNEKDKQIIHNYITNFGVDESNFIGVERWLQNWSCSNQKLYKLLGNRLIVKIPYNKKFPEDILRQDFDCLVNFSKFLSFYRGYYRDIIEPKCKGLGEDQSLAGIYSKLYTSFFQTATYCNDKVGFSFKIKLNGKKKTLQIQPDMKPIRALNKIIEYFGEMQYFIQNGEDLFEKFRIQHSMILNSKNAGMGDIILSIHPMDYMTMSDNDNNWSSCMSWTDKGCYRIGTVEMMNSNNVLCAYLESSNKFIFDTKKDVKISSWNNKKWRTLIYVNKDIIMSGKSYPYANNDLSKDIIAIVKDFAKKNLGWDYKYGPELYQDMKYVYSLPAMENNKYWIRSKQMTKHNILWDTCGMYNDMLNDQFTDYWCYRNKVKHNKIYSVSGKTPCLCCGKSTIDRSEWDDDYNYNDRYENTTDLVCYDCKSSLCCEECHATFPTKLFKIKDKKSNKTVLLCKNCIEEYIHYCPVCKEPFYDIRSYCSSHSFFYKMPEENVFSPLRRVCTCSQECYHQLDIEKNKYLHGFSDKDGLKDDNLEKEFFEIFYTKVPLTIEEVNIVYLD